jgi:hypothetical protein
VLTGQQDYCVEQHATMLEYVNLLIQEYEYLMVILNNPTLTYKVIELLSVLHEFLNQLACKSMSINKLSVLRGRFTKLLSQCQLTLTYFLEGNYHINRKQRKKILSLIEIVCVIRQEWQQLYNKHRCSM